MEIKKKTGEVIKIEEDQAIQKERKCRITRSIRIQKGKTVEKQEEENMLGEKKGDRRWRRGNEKVGRWTRTKQKEQWQ
jgi:hypothetical protein